MDKETYLRYLRALLSGRLPASEVEEILRYYTEYFEDAGEDRVQDVMMELGTPEQLAQQILNERQEEAAPDEGPHRWHTPEFGGYSASAGQKLPRWAFYAIAAIIAVSGAPLWCGLVFGLGLGGLLCAAIGFWIAIYGLTQGSLVTTLYLGGGGLMTFAIGLLMLLALVVLVRLAVRGVRYLWGRYVEGGEG